MRQETALDILKAGRNVFLTGAAGTGKTYVLREYIQWLREHRVPVGITASTGIAATHLGGSTIHSWSGIGIKDDLTEWDLDALGQKQHLVKRLEGASVLVIDEVSMLAPHTLDMVDAVCKTLRRSREPFGGLQVVLSGDFYQLPPIVRGQKVGQEQFADSARAWQGADIRTCYLTEQYRQSDNSYANILNDIRDGTVTAQTRKALNSRIGATLEGDAEPTHLYTHNVDVDARNDAELKKLTTPSKVYEMSSKGRKSLVETLKKGLLAPERLELKEGALVMFVKNDKEGRYVNGTLGRVTGFEFTQPVVETFDGRSITVTDEEWSVEDEGKVLARVSQLPLRLAWAITVHKSQGMSLDAAEIDLSKAFAPGQGYVALSRLRTLEGLVLKGLGKEALAMHPYVTGLDAHLRKESHKWERVLERFSEEDHAKMQREFIARSGGVWEHEEADDDDDYESFVARARKTHKKAFARWAEGEEMRLVALHEQGLSASEIGDKLGRKPGGIQARLIKLGLIDVIE